MVTDEKLKLYTESVEKAYPINRNMIIGPISTDEYEHIIQIATSVLYTRDKIMQGGGFVQSIVNNDLEGAFMRADKVCKRAIEFFVYCKSNIIV